MKRINFFSSILSVGLKYYIKEYDIRVEWDERWAVGK